MELIEIAFWGALIVGAAIIILHPFDEAVGRWARKKGYIKK